MNIIERAGKQLGLKSNKSVIELAAQRLGSGEFLSGSAQGTPVQEAPQAPVGARRETQRQITIDFDRLRAKGFALPGDETLLTEELRLIKRPLLNAALSRAASAVDNPNLIMITSAHPNEGKTFFATNLAISMASEHDTHVLLVDADVANPTIPKVLDFEAEHGLIDVISGSAHDLADVLVRTNIPHLTVLPSGRPRPGASELLASTRMARLADDIAKRYADRIVILDSPPVLVRSEASVLARHVGQIVLIIEAERTSRTAVSEALALIGTDKLGGVVLNKMPLMSTQSGFGYPYGYGYDSR
jgi:protein-tyrosine kinase